jgi:hypothetical protein
MPLLATRHAAFETVGQIGIADRSQGIDDLLLVGIGNFHFALSSHAAIYVAGISEPEFSGEMSVVR